MSPWLSVVGGGQRERAKSVCVGACSNLCTNGLHDPAMRRARKESQGDRVSHNERAGRALRRIAAHVQVARPHGCRSASTARSGADHSRDHVSTQWPTRLNRVALGCWSRTKAPGASRCSPCSFRIVQGESETTKERQNWATYARAVLCIPSEKPTKRASGPRRHSHDEPPDTRPAHRPAAN